MARIEGEYGFTEKVKFDSPVTINEMIETLQEFKAKLGLKYPGDAGDSYVRVESYTGLSRYGLRVKAVCAEYRGRES